MSAAVVRCETSVSSCSASICFWKELTANNVIDTTGIAMITSIVQISLDLNEYNTGFMRSPIPSQL